MAGVVEGAALAADLRAELERVLIRIAEAGHIPARGEREIRLRIDGGDRLRWFEPTSVRVPASELGPGLGASTP